VTVLLFYLGLGALLTFEEAGVFLLPGDISMVAAGMHGAQGESFVLISWLVASAGMVLGASILFHAVQRTHATGRILPARVKTLIQRHGVWGVAAARLVPGLRNATVFGAASARLSYRRFLYGLVPAALVWSALLLALGWFGGQAMLAAFHGFQHSHILTTISVSLLVAAIVFVAVRLLSHRTRRASAETVPEEHRPLTRIRRGA
jgi:membrane protein DedA with SNARE-associated domain